MQLETGRCVLLSCLCNYTMYLQGGGSGISLANLGRDSSETVNLRESQSSSLSTENDVIDVSHSDKSASSSPGNCANLF